MTGSAICIIVVYALLLIPGSSSSVSKRLRDHVSCPILPTSSVAEPKVHVRVQAETSEPEYQDQLGHPIESPKSILHEFYSKTDCEDDMVLPTKYFPTRKSSKPSRPEERSRQQDHHRLLIVTNRLPMSVEKKGAVESWPCSMSSGGLVSALTAVTNTDMIWIGWPGAEISHPEEQRLISKKLMKKFYHPVFLTQHMIDMYYSGYSNDVLWPLFHYLILPTDQLKKSGMLFEVYEAANRMFAEEVLNVYRPGDFVWIHDYHLMLLPGMLRRACPDMKIGFFLHTPFPSSEVFRLLPQRTVLLRSLLSSDLIGFQVFDYCRHFSSACTRLLRLDSSPSGTQNLPPIDAFPIGIEPRRFMDALSSPDVQQHIAEIRRQFPGQKIIIGIDRLDYVKGIPLKIDAFEHFLKENRQWRGKVVLVQIAIPSRTEVPEYQKLARDIREQVRRVNEGFVSDGGPPIHYVEQSIVFAQLAALYTVADMCLITSLRDGMNLVSFEFIASQTPAHGIGVLMLSEFCGASQSLGAGAIVVSPWDIHETAKSIKFALEMSPAQREEYHRYAMQYVATHTAQHWAESFIAKLNLAKNVPSPPLPQSLNVDEVVREFRRRSSSHRVIVLGMVGTLTHLRSSGMTFQMYERFLKCNPRTLAALRKLAEDKNTTVVILTSRKRAVCESVLGSTPAWVAAENGFFLKAGVDAKWEPLQEPLDCSWMEEVQKVFDYFTERTPRSFTENEGTSMTWNYEDSDPRFAESQARDLVMHLVAGPLVNTSTEVIDGCKRVRVRPAGFTKGAMCKRIFNLIQARHQDIGFVLCIGAFLSRDEDVFEALSYGSFNEKEMQRFPPSKRMPQVRLPEQCFVTTVNVGGKAGKAQKFIRSSLEVESFLRSLAETLGSDGTTV